MNIYKKQFLSLVLLLCFAILIWINGPILKIGNTTPLLDPHKRLYVIISICLIWFLKCIFVDTAPTKTSPLEKPNSLDAQKKIHCLQGRFYGALRFLKKTIIDKYGKNVNLARLPWYLFIGPMGSGKTTLLANSNIHFILSKQFKVETAKAITSSDNCDWWVTRDLVLVDVPGSYLTSKTKEAPQTGISHFLWRHLLSLIKKTHAKDSLQGILIALHLPEIIKFERSKKNQIIYDLKKRIVDVTEQFGRSLPIHLIITKCDLLPGFTEFFSECSSDEVAQTWGITLEPSNETLPDLFTKRFEALIKRINKQLIWRMHQERDPNARPYIKDFPLHLERLKEAITQLLKTLMIPHLPLQGVYLTSSSQEYSIEETPPVKTTGAPAHFNTQALQIMSAPPMPARSYFARQLILMHLPKMTKTGIKLKPSYSWKRRILYAASAATIITVSFFLVTDFKRSVQRTYSIQYDLTHYQQSVQEANEQTERLLKALPLLNSLQHTANHTTRSLSLAYYSHKSQQTANEVYQQALRTILLPDIKHFFESYLQTENTQNSENSYAILKAYLMLNDKDHFNSNYIAKSLQQVLPKNVTSNAIEMLVKHIKSALNQSKTPILLNQELITNIRKELTNLPPETLGFVILKNMGNNNLDSPISLGTHLNNPSVFILKSIETIIPSMYTASNFQKILTEESYTAATEASQGNWVLGFNLIVTSQSSINALANQLRTQYIANYVDIWESILDNIQLTTPHNLADTNSMIETLMSDKSPLLQLLDTIKENTAFPSIVAVSPKLQSLSTLLMDTNNHETSELYHIFINLKKLHAYLDSITKDPDGKITFEAAVKRMQNSEHHPLTQLQVLADQSPLPMKTWLNTLAQQTWHFILQDAAHYVEVTWQKEIMPTYHSEIENHYPFNQNAAREVSLSDLTDFMGQQGSFSNFYQHYFKPFINETDDGFEWRTLDHQKIPFSDKILTQLEYVIHLQHVFFPNKDNKLSIQFALQPISMDSNTKGFTLNINGQQVSYHNPLPHSSRLFSWPGNNTTHATSYSFITSNSPLTSNTIKGDWSWFRLIANATKNMNSQKEIVLTFNNNGHTAKYLLFTQGQLNPFLPLNLSRFELSDQLG
jgi:type VI secretion system protein ImpL